jgi:metal transporter CNNM
MEYLITLVLIAFSAMFSGLTLGYFSLDSGSLSRRARYGDKAAQVIYPIRQKGNQLLATLLLGNVLVNTILSVYLGSIASGIIASIAATTLIFIFGEIGPQAVISRHAMWFGNRLAPVVRIILILFYPITKPIAFVLDKILGDEVPPMYSKHEIMQIVSDHEDSSYSTIDADEERIVHGALQFSHRRVREIMTPLENVTLFDENQRLTHTFFTKLAETGYSRYPVYSGKRTNIVGILYTKDLLVEDDNIAIKETDEEFDTTVLRVRPSHFLDYVLGRMLKDKLHLAVVESSAGVALGVVSLEDIIEEIIQVEIEDEDDALDTGDEK